MRKQSALQSSRSPKAELNVTKQLYAEIIVPLRLPHTFTYSIPEEMLENLKIGSRVVVPFGRGKITTGVVREIHHRISEKVTPKSIINSLDKTPSFKPIQLAFIEWVSTYYMSTLGEALNCALPSGLKVTSEAFLQVNPNFNNHSSLSEEESLLLDLVQHHTKVKISDLNKHYGLARLNKIIKELLNHQAIILYEQHKEKYIPKVEKRIRLSDSYQDTGKLDELYGHLTHKNKQLVTLMEFLRRIDLENLVKSNQMGVPKGTFQKDVSPSSLRSLIRKKVFIEFDQIVSRIEYNGATQDFPTLTDIQKKVKQNIIHQFDKNDTVLLHGVTGSGKTEIYINIIKEHLSKGNQVLYLLPEIALTTQIVGRLRQHFGNQMGVFHSKYSDNERVEVWNGLLEGRFSLIIGVRSSIFLPFENLSLIIIDESHESSYKQFDPAPRYHARDSGIMLGHMHNANVLLGTATPSLEAIFNVKNGKYGLVELSERFGKYQLPSFHLIDMTKAQKKKQVIGIFSTSMINEIHRTLKDGQQVMIFQNRRGYAPFLCCTECGWIPSCINCSVSLTYHQFNQNLICHYCGHKTSMPSHCPECTSTAIKNMNYGTEKLEEDLSLQFPEYRISRMDLDTTRGRSSYEKIIQDFKSGKTDILVGTQMIAKGLDFDQVGLVGILDIDRMMHFPDFRSAERTFQLITQVAGRAGRKNNEGKVFIQTLRPEHRLIHQIKQHDLQSFYNDEFNERKQFNYPPFKRLIRVSVQHQDAIICREAADQLRQYFDKHLPPLSIMGPAKPMVERIRKKFIQELLIKISLKSGLSAIKTSLHKGVRDINSLKKFKSVYFVFDVDPV